MSERIEPPKADAGTSLLGDFAHFWRSFPLRGAFLVLLCAWVLLFQFFGNSTFGLVNTRSLFGWWKWTIGQSPDEEHAFLIPLVMIGLLLWKRKELEPLPKNICWPALALVVLALLIHVVGFMVQQARISFIGFALGLYGLTGVIWGARWMQATLFPFSLLVFCVPLGAEIERVTFPLRLLATKITAGFSNFVLGIPVIQSGTRLFEPGGAYTYDVAPACSGIRSLTAIIAFGVVYSFVALKSFGRRTMLVAAALPLAVAGNVFRLVLIVVAAETFGQEAGNYVHSSGIFSMAPYVPAILGMLLLGYWFEEDRKSKKPRKNSTASTPGLLASNAPSDS